MNATLEGNGSVFLRDLEYINAPKAAARPTSPMPPPTISQKYLSKKDEDACTSVEGLTVAEGPFGLLDALGLLGLLGLFGLLGSLGRPFPSISPVGFPLLFVGLFTGVISIPHSPLSTIDSLHLSSHTIQLFPEQAGSFFSVQPAVFGLPIRENVLSDCPGVFCPSDTFGQLNVGMHPKAGHS